MSEQEVADGAGRRLRAARMARGMRQADLAKAAGISASYLNLIEHDRRRIGGRLLHDLARELGLEPSVLTEGADSAVAGRLAAVAARAGSTAGQAEDLAARHPDWATLILNQAERLDRLEARVTALTDRLAHDPQMAEALHDVISAVTAIRSTAAILTESEELDADWRRRFHANLHQDALRLTERSGALLAGLESPAGQLVRAPWEEAEAVFTRHGYHFAALEEGGDPGRVALQEPGPTSPSARRMLARWLARYAQDAMALPLEPFSDAARARNYDPLRIARDLNVPLARVLRRLSSLPEGEGHPAFGITVCDGGGGLLFRKPLARLTLPRGGGGCPLWPLYGALLRPGQPIDEVVRLPDAGAAPLRAVAIADPQGLNPTGTPRAEATMLLSVAPEGAEAAPVGPGCRSCAREQCSARREPVWPGGAADVTDAATL